MKQLEEAGKGEERVASLADAGKVAQPGLHERYPPPRLYRELFCLSALPLPLHDDQRAVAVACRRKKGEPRTLSPAGRTRQEACGMTWEGRPDRLRLRTTEREQGIASAREEAAGATEAGPRWARTVVGDAPVRGTARAREADAEAPEGAPLWARAVPGGARVREIANGQVAAAAVPGVDRRW